MAYGPPSSESEREETAPDSVSCVDLGHWRAWFPAPAPGDTLHLAHRLLSTSSVRVSAGGRDYLAGRDYDIDALAGEIRWHAPPPDAERVLVTYRYLPLHLWGIWGGRTAAVRETLAVLPAATEPGRGLPADARLAIGGSKTLSLEFGNRQDVKLDQSLDLTVRGDLARDVHLRAVLTDRSTPLQPEGTTTELSDLDQVLIEVTAPWGEMRLGDVGIRQGGFAFLSHQREMEGLRLQANGTRRKASAAIGRGVGRQVNQDFLGQDGKQGPYRLLERMPGEDAVVVAGSERVWLDGQRLRRGEDSDYTIDYAAGELWFTARHPVSAASEIRVSFQAREGAFDRSYYALSGAVGDTTRGLAIAWLREADDPGRALTAGLSAAERESLRAAGDVSETIGGGVRADSSGDYALVETDSLDTPIFLFVAEDEDPQAYASRYAVAFTDAGEGNGDYIARLSGLGRTYYAYVGRRQGRYLPGRRLTPPAARDIVALRASQAPGAGLTFSAEGALSHYDANLLSPMDDQDNVGGALALAAGWKMGGLWGGRPERVELQLSGRDVEQRFSYAEPLDPSFAYRRWNASTAAVLDGRDRRGALGLVCRPGAGLQLACDWNALETPQGFDARRWSASAERRGLLLVQARFAQTQSNEAGTPGRGRVHRLAVGYGGSTGGEIAYDAEERLRGAAAREAGEGYRTLGARFSSTLGLAGVTAVALAQWREDRRWENGRAQRDGERRLLQAEGTYSRAGTFAHLLFARRTLTARDGGRSVSDLADWAISREAGGSAVSGEWRGRITAEEARLRSERLSYVGFQEGHYDSLGQYVGQGDYELYYEPGDSSALEARLETAARLSARPFLRSGAQRSILSGLEGSLFGRLEVSVPRALGRLLGDGPALWAGSSATREHDRLVRGEAAWSGGPRLPAPRVLIEGRSHRDGSPSGLVRHGTSLVRTFELRWVPHGSVRGRLEGGDDREREDVAWGGTTQAGGDERRTRRIAAESTWSLLRRLTLRGRGEHKGEDYQPGGVARSLWTATGGVTAEPLSATRLELTFERRWVRGEALGGLPFLVDRAGWRLTCTGSLRPRLGVTFTLWLRIDRETGQDTVASGRMEARAYF